VTSAKFNYFFRVKLNLVEYAIGGLTANTLQVREVNDLEINLVNKPVVDGLDGENETYWPILTSIGEVTLAAGDILPSASVSEIVINNAIGSFGADRKLSDLFERYSIVGQTVTVYVGSASNFLDRPDSWEVIGTGKVASWTTGLAANPPTLTLQVTPFKISDRVLSLEVAPEIDGMELAPESSIGKPLPIVLCKRDIYNFDYTSYPQISPIRITADGQSTARYAVCTLFYRHTRASLNFNNAIYVKKAWEDQQDIWTAIGLDDQGDDYLLPATDPVSFALLQYSLDTYSAVAYKIPDHFGLDETWKGLIATGVKFTCIGNGTAGRVSSGRLSVFILRVRKNTNSVVGAMTQGQVVLANYDYLNNQLDAFGDHISFEINVSFDQAVVIDPGDNDSYDFYIGWEYSNNQNQVNNFGIGKYTDSLLAVPPPTYAYLFRSSGSAGGTSNTAWRTPPALDNYQPAFQLQIASGTFNEHVESYSKDGLTYASIELAQVTPDSGQVNPSLDAIELIVPAEGFFSYAPPTIIVEPQQVLKHVSYIWNGEEWVDDNAVNISLLDESHYAPLFGAGESHRARQVSGAIDEKINYQDFINQLARGTACRIGVTTTGQIYLYPWGITTLPAFAIGAEDIIPLSWEARNDSTIVNRVSVTCDKIYTITNNQREEDGYALSIDYGSISYMPVEYRTVQSTNLYGVRSLEENKFPIFGFNNTGDPGDVGRIGIPGYLTGQSSAWSVDFLADYYISRFALPMTYCSFVVPYHRYKGIKMFDVIQFSHPAFPAFYGTDPNARSGVVDDGTVVAQVPNANNGEEFVRAKTYRGLVEAVSYVLAMEHAPAIRLTVQVILNRQFDPT